MKKKINYKDTEFIISVNENYPAPHEMVVEVLGCDGFMGSYFFTEGDLEKCFDKCVSYAMKYVDGEFLSSSLQVKLHSMGFK